MTVSPGKITQEDESEVKTNAADDSLLKKSQTHTADPTAAVTSSRTKLSEMPTDRQPEGKLDRQPDSNVAGETNLGGGGQMNRPAPFTADSVQFLRSGIIPVPAATAVASETNLQTATNSVSAMPESANVASTIPATNRASIPATNSVPLVTAAYSSSPLNNLPSQSSTMSNVPSQSSSSLQYGMLHLHTGHAKLFFISQQSFSI